MTQRRYSTANAWASRSRMPSALVWGSRARGRHLLVRLEAYLHPRTAALTLRMMEAFDWWQNSFLKDIGDSEAPGDPATPGAAALRGATAGEGRLPQHTRGANLITYRTPHYMLSSAVDHRAGYGGDQHHIWQATLGPDAVCFTAHPAKREGADAQLLGRRGHAAARGAGEERADLRVSDQHDARTYVTHRLLFTHAWLPKDASTR